MHFNKDYLTTEKGFFSCEKAEKCMVLLKDSPSRPLWHLQ